MATHRRANGNQVAGRAGPGRPGRTRKGSTGRTGRPRRKAGESGAEVTASPPPPDAREVAATVLNRVADQGAYAMRALDAELSRAQLLPRDAALATEIVYGALRVLPALDAALSPFLKRPLAEMDPFTRAVMRAAVYQLQHLGRVPAHAVVDAAVRLLRTRRSRQSAGFANAVLRRVAERRPDAPRPPTRLLPPAWLLELLAASLTHERVEALLEHGGQVPPLGLAVPDPSLRPALAERLGAELGALSPHALLMRRAGDPRRLPGFTEGDFWVQEEGAQLVALAVGAQPGERIADVCAGHGGKSLLLAAQLRGHGGLTSIDIDERKLEAIPGQLQRLGLAQGLQVECEAIDVSVGLGGLEGRFDRVLVDAPCTGLGTIHRRPELMLRLAPEDVSRMAALQGQILRRAAALVRPGGTLTYAVCSPTTAEGSRVAERLEGEHGALTRLDPAAHLPGITSDSDRILRIGGWLARAPSAPDAYQVVSWHVHA